ncbi:MAG: hypothetical protein N3A54_00180 [Patescibacteria group bacterium]|nr:hypothetical protein [Patescibacteria group bacterium]
MSDRHRNFFYDDDDNDNMKFDNADDFSFYDDKGKRYDTTDIEKVIGHISKEIDELPQPKYHPAVSVFIDYCFAQKDEFNKMMGNKVNVAEREKADEYINESMTKLYDVVKRYAFFGIPKRISENLRRQAKKGEYLDYINVLLDDGVNSEFMKKIEKNYEEDYSEPETKALLNKASKYVKVKNLYRDIATILANRFPEFSSNQLKIYIFDSNASIYHDDIGDIDIFLPDPSTSFEVVFPEGVDKNDVFLMKYNEPDRKYSEFFDADDIIALAREVAKNRNLDPQISSGFLTYVKEGLSEIDKELIPTTYLESMVTIIHLFCMKVIDSLLFFMTTENKSRNEINKEIEYVISNILELTEFIGEKSMIMYQKKVVGGNAYYPVELFVKRGNKKYLIGAFVNKV